MTEPPYWDRDKFADLPILAIRPQPVPDDHPDNDKDTDR